MGREDTEQGQINEEPKERECRYWGVWELNRRGQETGSGRPELWVNRPVEADAVVVQ